MLSSAPTLRKLSGERFEELDPAKSHSTGRSIPLLFFRHRLAALSSLGITQVGRRLVAADRVDSLACRV
jgi:hypothetical protein